MCSIAPVPFNILILDIYSVSEVCGLSLVSIYLLIGGQFLGVRSVVLSVMKNNC